MNAKASAGIIHDLAGIIKLVTISDMHGWTEQDFKTISERLYAVKHEVESARVAFVNDRIDSKSEAV